MWPSSCYEDWMCRTYSKSLLLIGLMLLASACATPAVKSDVSPSVEAPSISNIPDERRLLAGEWEYEDGAVVILSLDERGNGTYPWKEGRFETTTLNDHTWHGLWFQKENDREGGFRVKFSQDFSEGEGRWWYTRIGEDNAPDKKGGTFHLSRKSQETASVDKTPAP